MKGTINNGGKTFTGMGDGSQAQVKMRRSAKGHYYVKDSRRFDNVTSRDLELRTEYARDIIAQNMRVPKESIRLTMRGEPKKDILTTDEIYHVRRGVDIVGKVAIRIQTTFKGDNLIIVYSEKRIKARETHRNSSGMRGINKVTRASSQKKATARRKRDTRTY